MRYDCVIFDLDGTLSDSSEGIMHSALFALEKMGREALPETELRKFMGPPLADSFRNYCGMNEEDCVRATEFYRDHYVPVGWQENSVYLGIRELLKALKENGAYLAVATGKPQKTSEKILEFFGIADYFDAVSGPDDTEFHADKADLIRRVLPEKYDKAVMIGDRDSDVIAAQQLGMDGVAALYGFGTREEFEPLHPAFCADSVDALGEYLLGETPKSKGYFISFEGLDGCGKTTQINALTERLHKCGYRVRYTREPGGCPISEKIRDLVLDKRNTGIHDETEALLYAASRAQLMRDVILPSLAQGDVLVCDRYVDSSIAYQGGGRRLGVKAVADINQMAIGGLYPDKTIYLRLDRHQALERRRSAAEPDRLESERDDFFARTEAAYDQLAQYHEGRYFIVDAKKEKDVISEEIAAEVLQSMKEAGLA